MGSEGLISRVADHCFWFGRYVERAESTARLLEATRTLAFDADLPALECWQPVVIVSGQFPTFSQTLGAQAAGDGEVVQRYMTWADDNPVSLRASLRAAREVAWSIRDVLSLEVWEVVNELYLWLGAERSQTDYWQDREAFYRRARQGTQLGLGLVRSTMLHEAPMDFLWLGVMIERVSQTARMLDMHHHTLGASASDRLHPIVQNALWLSLLRACSGFEPFMKRNQGRVTRTGIVSFLFFEESFPRSLRYCIRSGLKILRAIWPEGEEVGRRARERLEALDHWLGTQQAEVARLQDVHDLLTHIVDEAAAVCGLVGEEIAGPPIVAKQVQAAAEG
jgi:uncharacterized alpha-E superfamily protein